MNTVPTDCVEEVSVAAGSKAALATNRLANLLAILQREQRLIEANCAKVADTYLEPTELPAAVH
ncbi:MAG: hypothetical protein C0483_06555 [Pirellula sp.]|nr:hypothetical protein [Pirellula sp.]